MKQTLTLILALALLAGCKTTKPPAPSPILTIPIEKNTNTKIVHTETIDTVIIEIPQQSAERTTTNKYSHLETDYAESDARINEDGTLSHTLNNKPTKHPVPVKNSTDTIYIEKAVEIPILVEVPVQVERQLSRWEKTRLDTWVWLATALAICAGWFLRKPLINLALRYI